jgi:hypothetical protein
MSLISLTVTLILVGVLLRQVNTCILMAGKIKKSSTSSWWVASSYGGCAPRNPHF